jgi:predicted RNase H-like HicB family nuclease
MKIRERKYLICIEKAEGSNYSAYVPDLPGCIACGDTLEETKRLIAEAIDLYIRGMTEDGEPVPEPTTESDYVTVHAA